MSALIMERFAFPSISPTDDAYLLGLMHSVGKLVVEECLKRFPLVSSHAADPDMPALSEEMEMEIFGCRHSELGAQLLERWRFPPSVVRSLRMRFKSDAVERDALVCLLDWATALRKANSGDKRHGDWDLLPDHFFYKSCDLDEPSMRREIRTARQTFYQVRESIMDDSPTGTSH